MAMIRKREHHEETRHYVFFQEKGQTEGSGFIFPCDAAGQFERPAHEARAAELAVDDRYEAARRVESVHRWSTPAAIRCRCGSEVELHGFTNTCVCGADFNMSGQELAPREQWGDETGESLADILRIP